MISKKKVQKSFIELGLYEIGSSYLICLIQNFSYTMSSEMYKKHA